MADILTDILTDGFVLTLSQKMDPRTTTPEILSTCLGFARSEGSAAAIQANVIKNQHSAFEELLFKYVMKDGRKSKSALNLRAKFLEKGMTDYAEIIEAELVRRNIPFLSNEDTLVEMNKDVYVPPPPCVTPGEGAEAAGTTQTDAKTKKARMKSALKAD